ncbi:hypothetical protein JTE90_004505 [Oedothorax gibbosus]|uniref:Uncharacterized protein n=1 Tax=Oedothorax gibbosus TaxID=931172 RepID=A0AAV6U3R1_9ARAC|nr:hypothetical protein JTE90_004505 [Oedothorax gibbosus]
MCCGDCALIIRIPADLTLINLHPTSFTPRFANDLGRHFAKCLPIKKGILEISGNPGNNSGSASNSQIKRIVLESMSADKVDTRPRIYFICMGAPFAFQCPNYLALGVAQTDSFGLTR